MKKRILLFCFMFLFSVAMIGCNDTNNTTTTGSTATTTLERLATPTGLTVAGQVLSWNAVPNAAGYAIYVNDVLQTTVTGTSFNFASLTGNQLLFRVVAKAPTSGGYADSLMSASAAYVANAATEISAINALLTDFMPGVPEGFAAELVRKGMTAEQFGQFKTAMTTFMDTMNDEPNATSANAALGTLLATNVNTEALFGGLVLMMRETLASEIANLEAGKAYCQQIINAYGNDWYCEMPMSSYESELAMNTALRDMLVEEADQIALIAANTVEYITLLQTHLTGTLLTNIETMIHSSTAPTAAELLTIKNEIIAILLENMPPVEDFELLTELFGGMISSLEGGSELGTELAALSGPFATMSHSSLYLYLKFFESLDVTFFTSLLSLTEAATSMEAMQLEIQILFAKAFYAFKNANVTLFTAVENALSDSEKQALYEAFASSMPSLMAGMIEDDTFDPEMIDQIFVALTWPIVSGMMDVDAKVSDLMLAHFVATDFAFLRKQTHLSMFDYDYWEDAYVNRFLNDVYENYTDYSFAKRAATIETAEAGTALAKAILSGTNQEDLNKTIDFILAVLPIDQIVESFAPDVTYPTADYLNALRATVNDQSDEVRSLLVDLADYLIANNVFLELNTRLAAVYVNNRENFGANYMEGYYDDTLEQQAIAIFVAKHLDAFFTSSREATFKGIANEVFDLLDTAPYRDLLGFTTEQIASLRSDFITRMDDVLAKAEIIRGYDAFALTPSQEAAVTDFTNLFEGAN